MKKKMKKLSLSKETMQLMSVHGGATTDDCSVECSKEVCTEGRLCLGTGSLISRIC
jgi:hypothetical protein